MREQKKENREKIKELEKQKREMQDELDELEGKTVKGKIVCALVFLATIGLLLGLFAGMVKMNVGDVAGAVFAPVIGDVPVLRSILPADLQRKTAAELAAEEKAAADAKAKADEEKAAAEAALQDYVDTYSAMAPEDAAKLFENMIPTQIDLVVRILENLTPDQRAAILSKMNVANAALMTERMKK